MPQKVKETKHTVQDNGLETIKRIMQVLFALVLFLLVFRLAFKLLGANSSNVFVNLIYATTAPLVGLFEGIFPEMTVENNTLAVFEPSTVIAIIVTAVVGYIVLKLLSVKQDKRTEYVEVQEQMNAVPLGQVSEAQLDQVSAKPVAQSPETPVAPTNNTKLKNETQELEERIQHQKQVLEDQRKMHDTTQEERESRELEAKIRHQDEILEDQQEVYSDVPDENEVPLNEKRRRQI